MSDEIRYDAWLASDPDDLEEARHANALERRLVAALAARGAGDGAHPTSAADGQPSENATGDPLESRLVAMSSEMLPDEAFAGALLARLEQRIHEHNGRGQPDEARPPETGGAASAPAHERRRLHLARRYRVLWASLAALLLLTLLFALPPVRARLREPLCLGAVCITLPGTGVQSPHPRGSPTSSPTAISSPLDLDGRTTLADARAHVTFPVRLPAYPADLGEPDYVFLQDLDGAAIVLVWVDHAHPDHVRMSLSELSSGVYVSKSMSNPVVETTVHGRQAFWTTGPYFVQVRAGIVERRELVTGHDLIWVEGNITYRLETSVAMDVAIHIAESLR